MKIWRREINNGNGLSFYWCNSHYLINFLANSLGFFFKMIKWGKVETFKGKTKYSQTRCTHGEFSSRDNLSLVIIGLIFH